MSKMIYPRKGELVAACGHADQPPFHFYRAHVRVETPEGAEEANWILQCDECQKNINVRNIDPSAFTLNEVGEWQRDDDIINERYEDCN